MSSIFEKVSTRMFCISGALNDIYCTSDLRIYSFEELLNEKLKSLGYQYVVFYSGAKQRMFAIDSECGRKLEELTGKRSADSAAEHPSRLSRRILPQTRSRRPQECRKGRSDRKRLTAPSR